MQAHQNNRSVLYQRALVVTAVVVLGGCAGLLTGKEGTPSPVPYRTLALSDFRARKPPSHLEHHGNTVGAALCGQIIITDDSGFSAQRLTGADGNISYRIRIRELGFRGEMLPGCSWWDPQLQTRSFHHVLQHEQVHFALIEIAARQLNVQAARLRATFEAIADTRELAEAAATDTIEAITMAALTRLRARHTRFDTESRHHILPEHQQYMWWQRVQKELAESDPSSP